MSDFKLDKDGNLVMQPVTGYELSLPAGIGVLLSIEFVMDLHELEAGVAPQRVQLLLTPDKALELADSLRRAVERFYQVPPGAKFQ